MKRQTQRRRAMNRLFAIAKAVATIVPPVVAIIKFVLGFVLGGFDTGSV